MHMSDFIAIRASGINPYVSLHIYVHVHMRIHFAIVIEINFKSVNKYRPIGPS